MTRIPERQAQLDALTRKYLSDPEPEPNGQGPDYRKARPPSNLADERIIELARNARNSSKFSALYDAGDTSLYEGDDSRADLALMRMFAFYTQDVAQLEELFDNSALGQRPKWRNRADYRRRTAEKALSSLRETYTPPPKVRIDPPIPSSSVARDAPTIDARGGTFDPKDDRGLTAALADAITAEHHFARDAGGKLYVYEKGVYKPDGDRLIAKEIKQILNTSEASAKWTTHRAREVTEYIRVDAPNLWERPPLHTINVRNGLLSVETGTLRDHSPDFLSPVQLPVAFDPEAACPAWEKFAGETFPEDAQELAFEIPASLMAPNPSIQKAILALGEGANGKSTYLAAVEAFVGRENCVALSLQKIETDRFAAARLVGMLANICPDLPSDHLASTSVFKAIVGGDRIVAEYKYRDSFDVLPFARLVFSANHPPRSGDASHAFYRRWVVVPFNRTFEADEQRPRAELDDMLSNPSELSGVLNRALDALKSIRERGGFSETESTRGALAEFQQSTDPLSVWLDRNTIEHPAAMVAQDELRREYNVFCENSGKPGMTAQAFGRALARAKPGIEKAQRTWRGKPNTRVYLGIGLATGGEDPPDQDSRECSASDTRDPRVQRDQRNDPICFSSQAAPIMKNNRQQRVDRVDEASLTVHKFLEELPAWLRRQLEQCRENEATIKPTCSSIAYEVFGTSTRWEEVKPFVDGWLAGEVWGEV